MSDGLKVLAYGAGAIGTYVGGSLALAGHQVVFIERPEVVVELREKGLHMRLGLDPRRRDKEEYVLLPPQVEVVDSLQKALAMMSFDVSIFALKSYDTPTVLESMKPFKDRVPPVLCLMNGVDNEPVIAAALGKDKVIYGSVSHSVERHGPGDIVLEKLRGIGIAEGHPLSKRLVEAFDGACLNGKLYPRAADMKWSKMLINLLGNASSAILDMTVGEVFSDPRLCKMEIRMIREMLAVMKVQGISVVDVPATPVRLLATAINFPASLVRPLMVKFIGGGRGGKMPSFHIDLHSGRKKSEIDYYNGAVIRAGEKYGIPTPVNKVLTETVLALTEGRIPLTEYSRQPEKLLALVP